eukprot:CAMPEP_0195508858 /NCGR_PEP_ID=MMETSP0794_2-20130614/1962_1 /TAXON_ID=515487 /ORGANISM="Stephanopyxis turris, Strain CCMP 815" /LENGTH=201 /DNA_ID=CAMNT_0040635939 /DNA_START=194 /DNA_END=799 /DNA_ORIENTATION=+
MELTLDGTDEQRMNAIMVTQMAALILLGEFHHARHLFRRYSSSSPLSPPTDSDKIHILWEVCKSMLKHEPATAISKLSQASNTPILGKVMETLRDNIAEMLASTYIKIDPSTAAKQLGIPSTVSAVEYLQRRGWTVLTLPCNREASITSAATRNCLVPPKKDKQKLKNEGKGGSSAIEGIETRLQNLTDAVSFMELSRMNA